MNPAEFNSLSSIPQPAEATLSASEVGGKDRTLLYGYTIERLTFHVYLEAGRIHKVIYDANNKHMASIAQESFPAKGLVPNKRLYPEACDFRTCELLRQRGIHLPFTTFNIEREPSLWHGKRLSELVK